MERILSTLCYITRGDDVLMLYRNKKKNDVNEGKWIGVGGHFEMGESPEECLVREVREETGLTLKRYALRGFISFQTEKKAYEYITLFTSDDFEGELSACNEGELEWIPKAEIGKLSLWEGDRIFLKLLEAGEPFFSLKLSYKGDRLQEAVLNGQTSLI